MSLMIPQEKLWDMPLGGTSTEKQMPHWTGNIIWALAALGFKVMTRYHVDGRENLRAFGTDCGAVLVCNHTSFFDVGLMYVASRPQWVRIMGRDTLFEQGRGVLGFILSRVGAFPVKRDSADRTAIKRATTILKNNGFVGILPEGTRRGKGSIEPELHAGAAFIARMGNAPLIPMTVRDVEKVKQKGERIRFPKVTIEYGKPILVGDFDFLPKDDRLEACVWYVMRECFALSRRIPREQVDMVELFPKNRDFSAEFAEHPLPVHDADQVCAAMRASRVTNG